MGGAKSRPLHFDLTLLLLERICSLLACGLMDMEMLPVVDVNVESVESTWPALMAAVGSADFVSLDLVRSEG